MNKPGVSPFSVVSTVRLFFAICAGVVVCGNAANAQSPAEAVEGLWNYTGLVTSKGDDMPLTGVILFKDGLFLQQSIFNGEPFEEQAAMAHAGTYTAAPDGIDLIAEQTISIEPDADSPLTFRSNTKHDIVVTREGDEMTLVFSAGTGTVQTFERLGDAEGEIYRLENGMLAFTDEYFILVSGTKNGVTSGYGTFERDEESFDLEIIRWAATDGSKTTNRRNGEISATFDGRTLVLENGQTFEVKQST